MKHTIILNGVRTECSAEMAAAWREMEANKQKHRKRLLREKKYYDYLLLTFERNERFEPFMALCKVFENDTDYWECLNLVYTDAIWPTGKDILLRLFKAKRANREAFMTKEDQMEFAQMPEALTIYRGYQKRGKKLGLSWTLSKEKAIWFAYRWSHRGSPLVAIGTCKKADVFGYCNDREEQEIVIDPKKIVGISLLTDIGPSPFERNSELFSE